jgi:putative endonuclease
VRYVYLSQSKSVIDQRYVGVTSHLKQRLADHNAGKSPHTSKYVPWKLVTYVAFSDLPETRFRSRVREEKAMVGATFGQNWAPPLDR